MVCCKNRSGIDSGTRTFKEENLEHRLHTFGSQNTDFYCHQVICYINLRSKSHSPETYLKHYFKLDTTSVHRLLPLKLLKGSFEIGHISRCSRGGGGSGKYDQ